MPRWKWLQYSLILPTYLCWIAWGLSQRSSLHSHLVLSGAATYSNHRGRALAEIWRQSSGAVLLIVLVILGYGICELLSPGCDNRQGSFLLLITGGVLPCSCPPSIL